MPGAVTAMEAEADLRSPLGEAAGTVRHLPIACLRKSYARLRPGALPSRADHGANLPLRVAMVSDGGYEILDGFKRLDRWQKQGHDLVPVVIEPTESAIAHKRLLLCANAPPRTLTAMDEARVVCSLVHEDKVSPRTAGHLLGRKRDWVERRLALGTRLSPKAADHLARGAIGPSLGGALVALALKDQDDVLEAIGRHEVPAHKALRLVAAYRVADETDRRHLLADPLGRLASEREKRPMISPRAAALERTLHGFSRTLAELARFRLPEDLAPPERRRLEAIHRSVLDELSRTAAALRDTEPADGAGPPTPTKDHDHDRNQRPSLNDHCEDPAANGAPPRRAAHTWPTSDGDLPGRPRGDREAQQVLQITCDRAADEPRAQGGRARARGGGAPRDLREPHARDGDRRGQARPVSIVDRGSHPQGSDHHTHPARDRGARLPGRPDDPGRARAGAEDAAHPPAPDATGQAALRDGAGRGDAD